ncbi:MAG TPA: hypothetical protein VLW83_17180, partial [Candidatus Acidoferrales bacterium]|nr:hypothetical protein [Candidatus Acidoferrales bacterium]
MVHKTEIVAQLDAPAGAGIGLVGFRRAGFQPVPLRNAKPGDNRHSPAAAVITFIPAAQACEGRPACLCTAPRNPFFGFFSSTFTCRAYFYSTMLPNRSRRNSLKTIDGGPSYSTKFREGSYPSVRSLQPEKGVKPNQVLVALSHRNETTAGQNKCQEFAMCKTAPSGGETLQIPAAFHGLHHRHFVGVFEVGADRNAH